MKRVAESAVRPAHIRIHRGTHSSAVQRGLLLPAATKGFVQLDQGQQFITLRLREAQH
jgi:hypothetical protein